MRNALHDLTVAREKSCSIVDFGACMHPLQWRRVAMFSQAAPRTYVECPRCGSPRAFVTNERFETQCSFCPECQYIWDSLRPRNPVLRVLANISIN